jgi:UDP-N-acetyl-D-mannosaminuronate dehydrogenase
VNNKICVIGLSYVDIPLAVAFAEKFQVITFDNTVAKYCGVKRI